MTIKGITFDFHGTLALGQPNKAVFDNSLLEYIRTLGFSGEEVELNKARIVMVEKLMKAWSLNREVRIEDLYQVMLNELGLRSEREVLNHIHQLYIRSFNMVLVPGAREVLEALSERYSLAIISNATSEVIRCIITELGLKRYFDALVVSRDLGIRKPDPKIFKFTLKSMGVESNEAFHVGDRLKEDIEGAKNAGMKTIWVHKNNEEMHVQPDHIIYSIMELTLLL